MQSVRIYMRERADKFDLGPPYKAMRQPFSKRQWGIYGTRQGVSAQVWEIACSHTFPRKRDAMAFMRANRLV